MISPKYDDVMKELFHNETVLRFFIGDVLGIPQEQIHTVRLRNTFLRKRYRMQKLGILDVLVILNNDTKINIELQVKVVKHWAKRQLFYLSKLYVEDMKIGEDYGQLRKCVGISILDFALDGSPNYHKVYRFRDKDGHELSDVLEIHILELRKNLTGQGEIDNWIRFFNAETKEDIKMIKTKNPGIREAIRELMRMSMDNPLRMRYEAYQKSVRDEHAREAYVKDEGRTEGRIEGRTEGRTEGRIEGKAEAILELLEEQGNVPQTLRAKILSERDSGQLSRWLKCAAKSKTVREFETMMRQLS